jgi:hypothetical protein
MEGSPQLRAVGGIAYYMSPPLTIKEAVLDPIHTAVYITYVTSFFLSSYMHARDEEGYDANGRNQVHAQRLRALLQDVD